MTCGLAESKVRHIQGKKLEFPLQWFTWYTGKPKPWKFTTCEGVFVNAYNLSFEQTKKNRERIIENGVRNFLGVEKDQPIFMDSGGFQFLRRGVEPDIDAILDFQIHSGADLIAVVDYPFSPKASTEEKLVRMERTLQNIEEASRFVSEHKISIPLVPVIHAHDEKILEKVIWAIRSIENKYDINFPVYALGSMVYMVSATLTARYTRYYRLIDLILKARELLPKKILHVFGVGSPNVMILLMYLGVDSIETFGWAGHGIHYSTYVAGKGTKALSDRKRALDSEFDWDSYFCECIVCSGKCPIQDGICKAYEGRCIMIKKANEVKKKFENWKRAGVSNTRPFHEKWIKKIKIDVLNSRGSWTSRACHNACVYSQEMKKAKKALKDDNFETFITETISNSLYNKARLLDYAKSRILELQLLD